MRQKDSRSGVKYNLIIFLRLQKFLLPYKLDMVLVYGFLAISSVFVLVIPALLGKAVDIIQTQPNFESITLVALGIIGSGILRGMASYGQAYYSQAVSQKIAFDIRNLLYDRFQRQSFSFFDKTPTAELMSRATADVEAIRMLISFAILRMVQVAVLLLMVTGILFSKNWQLALVTLAVLPFIGFRTTKTSRRLRPIWLSVQEGIAALSTILQENLSGMKVVKAFGREAQQTEKFNEQAMEVYSRNVAANGEQAANTALMTFAVYIAAGIQLLYGGALVIEGAISPGDLTSFIFYLLTITVYVRMIGWLGNVLSRAVAAGERIFDILDLEPEIRNLNTTYPNVIKSGKIEYDDVSFNYENGTTVLEEISFSVEPGETVAIVGATGSGKSTLINLLSRFYEPTNGEVRIDGTDIKKVPLESLRENIGFVQQEIFLFSTTIKENIAYGKSDASMESIEEAAKFAQMDKFISSLPNGYDSIVGERGINLSGGQRQRLAIARTILMNPKIVILDDSLSSVDTETEALIQNNLKQLIEQTTTIIVAQRIASIYKADKILVLDSGKIIQQGTHAKLIEEDGAYKNLYQLQLTNQNSNLSTATDSNISEPLR
tara:strand:+ start:2070 stop:3884 length:1815 start_codon:yes stop_codon:yes gene_type:complete